MTFGRVRVVTLVGAAVAGASVQPAAAQLFWNPPSFAGTPVSGGEPGVGVALPGATAKELSAHLIWNMRAGLNVAALQCQFAPALMSVPNYNGILAAHAKEFAAAYSTVGGYFKRTQPKRWQVALDSYTTKTYNGFSTLHAQLSFCQVASSIAAEALTRPKGQFILTAQTRMREFRNSLVAVKDRLYGPLPPLTGLYPLPPLSDQCWDKKKNRLKKACGGYA